MVKGRRGEDIFPPRIVASGPDYRLMKSRARLVARQRKTWAPLEAQVKRDEDQQPNKSGWTLTLVDFPLWPVKPNTVIGHSYTCCVPDRRELERQDMLWPEPDGMQNPYAVHQPEFAEAELAYRKGRAMDPDKRITTSLRISSGGDNNQYREGGPYSGSVRKSWHTKKTLSAHQLWKLVLNFEIALPPGEGAGLGRPVAGRPAGRGFTSSSEFFDSAQVWLAFAGQKANMSMHFSFLDPLIKSLIALEMTELKYEGDFEVLAGQVIESRLRIKLRPRTPPEPTSPPLRHAAPRRPPRSGARPVRMPERLEREPWTNAEMRCSVAKNGVERGDSCGNDSDGFSPAASTEMDVLD